MRIGTIAHIDHGKTSLTAAVTRLLAAPYDYEDHSAYWRELESLQQSMADVGCYDDWCVEEE